jgi:acetylornithine/N-succinyldiaminopimelate aminotransferase
MATTEVQAGGPGPGGDEGDAHAPLVVRALLPPQRSGAGHLVLMSQRGVGAVVAEEENERVLGDAQSVKVVEHVAQRIASARALPVADRDWLKRLEEQCRKRGALLIVDEIQTGLGRTGTLFAHEAYGIQPDAMTIAKGLGSGFPVGALLAKQQVAELFQPGTHGSTFGGNPLACAAAEATVKVLTETFDWQAYQTKIEWLSTQLQEVVQASPAYLNLRGQGFLQGIVTDKKAADIVTEMRREGVLVLIAGEDVVRILPPLTITKEELQTLVSALERVGRRVAQERGKTS